MKYAQIRKPLTHISMRKKNSLLHGFHERNWIEHSKKKFALFIQSTWGKVGTKCFYVRQFFNACKIQKFARDAISRKITGFWWHLSFLFRFILWLSYLNWALTKNIVYLFQCFWIASKKNWDFFLWQKRKKRMFSPVHLGRLFCKLNKWRLTW